MTLVASVFLLPSCSDDRLPTDLPLAVTETMSGSTVQVTVDPEGTVLTNRDGRTTRTEATDEDIAELRELMAEADLDDLDGQETATPRYVVLAGDVEIFLGPDNVPKRLLPVLQWIREHRG
jgi:hypothetical protein